MVSTGPNPLELFKGLKAFAEGERHDEFTLKRFKREVQKLLKADAVYAYMALGILAGIECDPEAVHENFHRAVTLSPNNVNILMNYATALGFLGFFSEAAELVLQAYGAAPRNVTVLGHAISYCHVAGRFHKTSKLIDSWHKIKPEKLHKQFLHVNEVVRFMDDREIMDGELEELVTLTMEVLHERGIYVRPGQIETSLADAGNGLCFIYRVTVRASQGRVKALNTQLTRRVRASCFNRKVRGEFIPVVEAIAF